MEFTKEQLSEVICKHTLRENGLQDLMEIMLESMMMADRYGNFHPQILAILRNQEDEIERLAGTLYAKGLTQEQVGDVFNDIYGEHYSKASISRMLDYLKNDVADDLTHLQ